MDNNESEVNSPGRLLKMHREQLDITMQDIAKRSRLDIKIIEEIEVDDYKNMPFAIYVRGYLRSYAKIVEADAEKVIALYNIDSLPPPDILPEVKLPTQTSSHDKPVKVVTYLISLGFVLLLLIWYQSNFVVEKITNNELDTINGVDISFDVVTHPEGWQIPVDSDTKRLTSATQYPSTELQTDDSGENSGISTIENIAHSFNFFATTGADLIVLTLSDDSWIEIVDADDEKLFYDLALANARYTIRGTAPFKLKFGFSDGVTVEFNGEPFDQSPYSNNGIARFTLPWQ